ncbi:MAG: Nif3-like dinuclear metal center hexameric protein [Bacteroidales bacterium]|nr:Nif3-like dinuclear metal center hexameric protein [Bacteroidales bacterium]
MQIRELVNYLNTTIPLGLQEAYDNSGLLVGNPGSELSGVLVSVDVTEEVIEEARQKGANFILSHHPLIFSGLKSITGKDHVERSLIKAIQNDIALYAAHTNLDNLKSGINFMMADRLGLKDQQILRPKQDQLIKMVFFVPSDHMDQVRKAVFDAGAGIIGDYDQCSYNLQGQGTFRPGEGSDPYSGKKGEMHFEEEIRVETFFPSYKTAEVINAMNQAHPYEEMVYDLYPLKNADHDSGAGVIGILEERMPEKDFLDWVKKQLKTECIRHTNLLYSFVSRVAISGGSGSFLLNDAISQKADVFISADFKYHNFFEADEKILIADIGHFESEQISKEFFYELLTKKFHNFATHLSEINTNPINYY